MPPLQDWKVWKSMKNECDSPKVWKSVDTHAYSVPTIVITLKTVHQCGTFKKCFSLNHQSKFVFFNCPGINTTILCKSTLLLTKYSVAYCTLKSCVITVTLLCCCGCCAEVRLVCSARRSEREPCC